MRMQEMLKILVAIPPERKRTNTERIKTVITKQNTIEYLSF